MSAPVLTQGKKMPASINAWIEHLQYAHKP